MIVRASSVLLSIIVTLCGCTRGSDRPNGFRLDPDASAVYSCASSIAISEGYEQSGRSASVGSPSDGMNFTERLQMRVRLTGDSALPNASIRTATYSGRSSAQVSPAGQRIVNRVNRECRFARGKAG